MNNKQIAQKFVEGATSGKGSNLFIEDDTIYSYGYHFPVARRLGNCYLFNSDSYSRSTSRHQLYIRCELPENRIIECPGCDLNKAREYITNKLAELNAKQSRARKTNYQDEIDRYNYMLTLI